MPIERRATHGRATAELPKKATTAAPYISIGEGDHTWRRPFMPMYRTNTPLIRATSAGTQRRAAATRSSRNRISHLIAASRAAATTPPMTGEMTQLATMPPMVGQATTAGPAAATPDPITPPTMAWVVDTGAPSTVARLTHTAAANRAAIISRMKSAASMAAGGVMMPLEMVSTTSPPARIAPAASHTAAMTRAAVRVMALLPTAGPTLLATSLAPMFRAR